MIDAELTVGIWMLSADTCDGHWDGWDGGVSDMPTISRLL